MVLGKSNQGSNAGEDKLNVTPGQKSGAKMYIFKNVGGNRKFNNFLLNFG